jgi:hypothetical protein
MLISPDQQLNVEADHRATAALDALRAAKQTTEFYPLPACRAYLATPPDISPVAKYARSEPNFLSTNSSIPSKRNNWSNEVYDSISGGLRSASAGLTDNLRTFVVKLSHDWLPIEYANDDAVVRLTCPQCSEIETVPHLYRCQSRAQWRNRFLIHLQVHLKETDTAADIRCTITKGIENWSPETRMILTALKQSPKSGSKFSKDTFQKSGL